MHGGRATGAGAGRPGEAASRLGPVPEGRPGPRGAGAAAAGPGSVLATLRAALPPAPASRGVRAAPHRKPDIRAPATVAREVRRGRGRTAPRSAARGARDSRAQTPREARALRRPRGPRAPASPSPRRGEPGGRAARAAAAPGGEAGERGAARRRRRAQGQGMADAPSACAYVRESGRGRARAEPGRPPRAPALAASPGARAAPPPPPAARAPRGVRGGDRRAGSEAPGSGGAGAPAPARVPLRLAPSVPARGARELQIIEGARKSARGREPAGLPVFPRWATRGLPTPPGMGMWADYGAKALERLEARACGLWGRRAGRLRSSACGGVGLKEEAGRGRHV